MGENWIDRRLHALRGLLRRRAEASARQPAPPAIEAPRLRREIGAMVRLPTLLHERLAVAGTRYHAFDQVRDRLAVHDALLLVREADNPHDGNAIAVHFDGLRIGYVPRRDAPGLANLLDAGHVLQARVAEPGRYDDHVYPRGHEFEDDVRPAALVRRLPPDGAEHWIVARGGLHEFEIWLGDGPLDMMSDEEDRARVLAARSHVTALGHGLFDALAPTLEEGQPLALRRLRGDRRFPHCVAVHLEDGGDDGAAGPDGPGFLGYVAYRHARRVAAHFDTGGSAMAVVAEVEMSRPLLGLDGGRVEAKPTGLVLTIQGHGGARTRLAREIAAVEAEIEVEATVWVRGRDGAFVRCSPE